LNRYLIKNKNTDTHLVAIRSVTPWDPNGDFGWRKIARKKLSNNELLAAVKKYPRHVD